MLEILVIVPLLISAIASIALSNREKFVSYVALGASLVSLLIAFLIFLHPPGMQSLTWFSNGGYSFQLSTISGPLNLLLLMLVAGITPLVMLYSMGFMRTPSEQRPFYLMLSLFAAAMMLFAIGGDLITIFIGWEFLGITSYLLIGFWRYKEIAINAARKAITIVFIGDILILGAIVLLWSQYHSFSLQYILTNPGAYPLVKAALVLIILGAFTKSAQFPFNEWLADAMEGPTPVSAFLHSSTMVKAGVFLVALLLPLIFAYKLNYLLLIVGIITALVGAIRALSETHVKRILAYSTMEDLGLMFIALGLNSVLAAMLLFFVQTFYKALLFMSAGAMMKANNDEEDITKIAGPTGYIALLIPMLLGAASLAGLFPLSGFFGKIGIEGAAHGYLVYAVLLLIDLLSSLYIFRWLLAPLAVSKNKKARNAAQYNRTKPQMIIPICILAALVVLSGLAYPYLAGYLGLTYGISISYAGAALYTVIILVGIVVAYFAYYKRALIGTKARERLSAMNASSYINKAYSGITAATAVAGDLVDAFDYHSYALIKGSTKGIKGISGSMRRAENGSLNYYLIFLVLGVIGVMILVLVL